MTETTNILHDKANLPEGYKNSPLGAIPKEWEVKKLGDISTQLGNFSFSRAQLTDKTQRLRYIHYGDIHVMSERDNVDLRKDDLPFLLDGLIDNTKIENQNFPLLQDGDVIFVDASEDYEGIGKKMLENETILSTDSGFLKVPESFSHFFNGFDLTDQKR